MVILIFFILSLLNKEKRKTDIFISITNLTHVSGYDSDDNDSFQLSESYRINLGKSLSTDTV